MFWSVDAELYSVNDLLKRADGHVKRAIERNMPLEDRDLLEKAFKHMQVFNQFFYRPFN